MRRDDVALPLILIIGMKSIKLLSLGWPSCILFPKKIQTIIKLLENFLIKGISSTPHGTCWTHAKNSANLNNLKAIVDVNYDVQIYQTNRTGNSSSLYSSLTDKSVLLFTSIISINIISINLLVSFYLCIYCWRNQHSPFNKCKFASN